MLHSCQARSLLLLRLVPTSAICSTMLRAVLGCCDLPLMTSVRLQICYR